MKVTSAMLSSREFLFYTRAGVQDVQLEGKAITGSFKSKLRKFYGPKGPRSLVEIFINIPDEPEEWLAFVKRYGPLWATPTAGKRFRVRLEQFAASQDVFRENWVDAATTSRWNLPTEAILDVSGSTRVNALTIQVSNLYFFLYLDGASLKSDSLRVCARTGSSLTQEPDLSRGGKLAAALLKGLRDRARQGWSLDDLEEYRRARNLKKPKISDALKLLADRGLAEELEGGWMAIPSGCPHRYFVATKSQRRYCSDECRDWVAAVANKHYWRTRGPELRKERKQMEARKAMEANRAMDEQKAMEARQAMDKQKAMEARKLMVEQELMAALDREQMMKRRADMMAQELMEERRTKKRR